MVQSNFRASIKRHGKKYWGPRRVSADVSALDQLALDRGVPMDDPNVEASVKRVLQQRAAEIAFGQAAPEVPAEPAIK